MWFSFWRNRHRFTLICKQHRCINQVVISATQSVADEVLDQSGLGDIFIGHGADGDFILDE